MNSFYKWALILEDNNRMGVLNGIAENPSDSVVWSAYADWLEENGKAGAAKSVRNIMKDFCEFTIGTQHGYSYFYLHSTDEIEGSDKTLPHILKYLKDLGVVWDQAHFTFYVELTSVPINKATYNRIKGMFNHDMPRILDVMDETQNIRLNCQIDNVTKGAYKLVTWILRKNRLLNSEE